MDSWSTAFVRQAAADLEIHEFLNDRSVRMCHRLHYLQMWLEKLCKAKLWLSNEPGDESRYLHNVVARVLPRLLEANWKRLGYERCPDMIAIRAICREIDLLHTQVSDGGRRPDNVEYPWPDGAGHVAHPAGFEFPVSRRLASQAGRDLLKIARRLTRNPGNFQ